MGFRVLIKGDFACFTRPELKVERYTYPVPTCSALRGLLESVYWHPGLLYRIDRIKVLNEVKYLTVKRNEVKNRISSKNVLSEIRVKKGTLQPIDTKEVRTQRSTTMLKDVAYIVDFHFITTNKIQADSNPAKFADIISRRLERGQNFKQPYLGCREMACSIERFEDQDLPSFYEGKGTMDLGVMLYDMEFGETIEPVYCHPIMQEGVIDFRKCEVLR